MNPNLFQSPFNSFFGGVTALSLQALLILFLQVSLQAGLRTLHEAGPELRRAISGSLEDIMI